MQLLCLWHRCLKKSGLTCREYTSRALLLRLVESHVQDLSPAEAHTGYKQPVACDQHLSKSQSSAKFKIHRNQIFTKVYFLHIGPGYTMCHLCQRKFSHMGQQRPWKLLRFKPLNANLIDGNVKGLQGCWYELFGSEFYFVFFSQSFQLMSQSLILDNLLNKTRLFSA